MTWPDPAPTIDDAMKIQQTAFEAFGSSRIGWKVAATNKPAQDAFGICAPFYGPMAASGMMENNQSLAKPACVGACEPEYAFEMSRIYPAEREMITTVSTVSSVHCAIEVIGRSIGNPALCWFTPCPKLNSVRLRSGLFYVLFILILSIT